MSMTKEQFLAQVEKRWRHDDLTEIMPAAEWIWDKLMFEGNYNRKVKDYEDGFETQEEKDEREYQAYLADQQRRADIREKVILRQMERTGQDRETVERLLP